jgi:hypothetical protein
MVHSVSGIHEFLHARIIRMMMEHKPVHEVFK